MPSPFEQLEHVYILILNMPVSQHQVPSSDPVCLIQYFTVLLTLLLPHDSMSFRISHQEMIKGIRIGGVGSTLQFYDTLEVPIIENTADEEDLTFGMSQVRSRHH